MLLKIHFGFSKYSVINFNYLGRKMKIEIKNCIGQIVVSNCKSLYSLFVLVDAVYQPCEGRRIQSKEKYLVHFCVTYWCNFLPSLVDASVLPQLLMIV